MHRVLGHSDVAPARKKDPARFLWHSLPTCVGPLRSRLIVRGETLKLGSSISDNVASMQTAFAHSVQHPD